MIPLSRPGGPEKKTFEHFAKKCDSYGREIQLNEKAKTEPIIYQIAMPDPNAKVSNDWQKEEVSACNSCANYIPPTITKRLTGWSAGYCRAKGQLILEDRLTKYAADCEKRVFQHPSQRLDEMRANSGAGINIVLFPEYDLFFGKKKPVDLAGIHKTNMLVRPQDWVSDRSVTDAHKRLGIRAFRRIQDPRNYGPDLVIPIMDEGFFAPEDRERIPQSGDVERPEKYYDHNGAVYKIMVMWTKLNQTPALWGPAGVGKTELFRHMAWMMGLPFQRISITESSELDDLIGKMMFTPDKGTFFQYGRIPRNWTRPNVLCLDEPNTGQPAIWQAIRPLTDDSKQMVIDQNGGERLPKHRICYLGMAMNPAWDPRNTGTAPLADADGSRLMHIGMDLPPERIERQILLEALADDKWTEEEATPHIDVLMRMAKEIRDLSNDGTLTASWGIRNQIKVVRLRRYATWTDCFRMGVVDALEPEVGDLIMNIVRSHAPNEDD
jgi:MoxR-like ATPase